MNKLNNLNSPFQIEIKEPGGRFRGTFARATRSFLERFLQLHCCQKLYGEMAYRSSEGDFPEQVLRILDIEPVFSSTDLERIPSKGATIVVANHPFGAVEGLVLAALLGRVRPDVKILANYLLQRIPEMNDLVIPVDPFGGRDAAHRNLGPTLESLRHLKKGGMLLIFPAGEVSHLHLSRMEVADPVWNSSLARMVRASGAPVLPVYFPGRNGFSFQLAGMLHPRLRTALLPRELLNKKGKTLPLRVGTLIPAARLREFEHDKDMVGYLRLRTYMLGCVPKNDNHQERPKMSGPTAEGYKVPVIEAVPVELLACEIAALPAGQMLAGNGDFQVWIAEAPQIPEVLREIGRLRELTFRLTGEGTGRAIDLDSFDDYYLHMFLWNNKRREIAGAYRCGKTDEILERFGVRGLYTHTLFKYGPKLLEKIGPALEMGRSFVRSEYQRSYAPLLLLWKGIGKFVVQNPRYRHLFGPVSITRDYSDLSRQLIVGSLAQSLLMPELAGLVRPRVPLHLKPLRIKGCDRDFTEAVLADIQEVSALIGEFEVERKGIPVLLRHYLNLGGKLLSFNIDPDFSEVLDGLVLVDLVGTEHKTLERYMTREGAASFLTYHLPGQLEKDLHCA